MSISEVSVNQLADFISKGSRVIDVRELNEYQAGHIPGAIHVPLATVPENIAVFKSEQTVFIVCRSGGRSMQACEFLHENEVTNVVNVEGGTMGWIAIGHDVITGDEPS
ncbi:MAG: rhodanese-like domain-containing protein [Actinobacteria bacterium]|nr:rhodanese-like domain-containing protein [Actinomycetota bacterium]